jgi:hypothetical protein
MRERRQSLRYAVNPNVFIVFNPFPGRLGKLKDVGPKGVGFEHAAGDNDGEVVDAEVDIFIPTSESFMLRRMPCKVIYDIKIEQPSSNRTMLKRCGLEFKPLSRWHSEQLKLFLDTCVSHPLPVLQMAKELEAW